MGNENSYPGGTQSISNGQRNASASIRLDGVLITAPEQGEGGQFGTYFHPNTEGAQEMKVENNSFPVEYGIGTVINQLMMQRRMEKLTGTSRTSKA